MPRTYKRRAYPTEQHTVDKVTDVDLSAINALLACKGLPTYTELACSLCEVLDGETHHDIVDLGISPEDAANINIIRHMVKPLYMEELVKING